MNLDDLLEAFKHGKIAAGDLKKRLVENQLQEMQDTVLDLQREERCGLPEIIYGRTKTVDQIVIASKALLENSGTLLATRVSPEKAQKIMPRLEGCSYNEKAQCIYRFDDKEVEGKVLIITAGTSDVAVAEEAMLVCKMFGVEVEIKPDVGVAALNRILELKDDMLNADCIIVCAGMEGALPSVVGGLVAIPVIAVPVSSGYGASLGGLSALLGMLNSCASGLTVVNIDNGFGAGYAAGRIIKMLNDRKS